ncbi:hypothetical protein GCM10023191_032120 [Actinoallomurus oryzae]|uniref:Uncharacterized protein n=1 Tax=Actinoallomurus oryzae TaxID=502180 RepID=A0ABP8PWV4_9ACTN
MLQACHDEQPHTVRHHLESRDLPSMLVGPGMERLLRAGPNAHAEDGAAVLPAPQHVVPDAVRRTE